MKRLMLVLALGMGVFATMAGHAGAFQSDPGPFDGLGLPEATLVITAEAFQASAEIPAGRVLITVDNQSDFGGDFGLGIIFMHLPEGVSRDQLAADLESDDIPSYFFDIVFAGGVVSKAHAQGQAVLEFTPGVWVVADMDGVGLEPVEITVTGEPAADPSTPESSLTVHMTSYGFDFPDTLPAGKQVWQVVNHSPVPHHIVLFKADRVYSAHEITQILTQFETGTPIAGAPSPEAIVDYTGIHLQSTDVTSWQVVDLEPGSYVAMCFMSDSVESYQYHAMQGMTDSFTVQ